jgi:hypothetical protein
MAFKLEPDQLKKIAEPFPEEALSAIDHTKGKDGKPLTSIKAAYVIERLNDVFGIGGWSYDFTEPEVVKGGKNKSDKEVFEAITTVTLTVTDNKGETHSVKNCGGHRVLYGSVTDARKSSVTDGLTKCASFLGIGKDVFKGLVRIPASAYKQERQERSARPPAKRPTNRPPANKPANKTADKPPAKKPADKPPANKPASKPTTKAPATKNPPAKEEEKPVISAVDFISKVQKTKHIKHLKNTWDKYFHNYDSYTKTEQEALVAAKNKRKVDIMNAPVEPPKEGEKEDLNEADIYLPDNGAEIPDKEPQEYDITEQVEQQARVELGGEMFDLLSKKFKSKKEQVAYVKNLTGKTQSIDLTLEDLKLVVSKLEGGKGKDEQTEAPF